jgi:xylulokinase
MAHFLGIDIGTSGTKVLLIDENGAAVGSHNVEYALSTPRPLWAEQDPALWWNASVEGVRALVAKTGVDPASIKGIGLSGQMHGSVFLDASNKVIRPALLWCDQRTQAECDWITKEAGGASKLAGLIANPVLTGFTAPKIVWLRNNEPKNYAKVVKVLLPKDYVRYELTGAHVSEVSDASGTALFDVANRCWSEGMLSAAGIPRSFMPECVESQEITGTLSPAAASLLGLPAGIPVVGGGGDQAAGAVGCGIVEPGIVSSTIGTSGVVFAYSDAPAVDPKMRIHTFCHAVPGKWHVMGVQLSSGGSLRWLRDTLYPGAGYDEITADAATAPAGCDGLIFLPYLTGERTPYPDPYARGTFFGLTLRHTRAHMARAVLEGVVYGLRDMFEIFGEIGVPINTVRASGGGAKSPVWRQINADIVNQAHVTLTIDEGPALGVALLAAVGTGTYRSVADACRAAITVRDKAEPDSDAAKTYNRFYPIFRALYPALKDQFKAVNDAVEG